MAKNRIISISAQKAVLREMLEEEKDNKRNKEMQKLIKEPEFWDDCPYCNTFVTFKNDNPVPVKLNRKQYITVKCNNCEKEVYMYLSVVESGDMMNGTSFDSVAKPFRKEDIDKVEIVDDKPIVPQKTLMRGTFKPKNPSENN